MAALSPWPFVRAHFNSLRDRSGRIPRGLIFINLVAPALAGLAAYFLDVRARGSDGLIAGVSLLGAGLFALLVRVYEMSSELADRARADNSGVRTVGRVQVFRSVGANVGYATLLCVVTAATLVIGQQSLDKQGRISATWTAITIALLFHLATTFLIVLRRTYRVLERELQTAETGDG